MSFKRQVSVAILVGASGMVGCRTPMSGLAFWKSSPESELVSSSPDVGQQKYDGLAQDFGSVSKPPVQGNFAPLGSAKAAESGNWFTSTWNTTTGAVASAFTWNSTAKSDDPTRLDNEPKKVGTEVYLSAGRLYENQGKFAEAQLQYEKALQVAPKDLSAQISLARLHDRQGQGTKALEHYRVAAKSHPKNALVQNDLGLCLGRQQQYPQSLEALHKATELEPANAKYRNNLAMVLVETGRPEDAFQQLAAVNPEAVAHYNLGILLQQKGQNEQAMQHLQQALAMDANLGQARDLLRQLSAGAVASVPRPEIRVAAQPFAPQVNTNYPPLGAAPANAYLPPAGPGYPAGGPAAPLYRPSAFYEGVPASQPAAGDYRHPPGAEPAPGPGTGTQSLPPSQ